MEHAKSLTIFGEVQRKRCCQKPTTHDIIYPIKRPVSHHSAALKLSPSFFKKLPFHLQWVTIIELFLHYNMGQNSRDQKNCWPKKAFHGVKERERKGLHKPEKFSYLGEREKERQEEGRTFVIFFSVLYLLSNTDFSKSCKTSHFSQSGNNSRFIYSIYTSRRKLFTIVVVQRARWTVSF